EVLMQKLTAVVVALCLAVPLVTAEEKKPDPDQRAKAIEAFVDPQTVVVAHVDLTRIDLDKLFANFKVTDKGPAEDLAQLKKDLGDALKGFLKAGGKDIYLVLSLADALRGDRPFFVVPVGEKADKGALGKVFDAGAGTSAMIGANLVL